MNEKTAVVGRAVLAVAVLVLGARASGQNELEEGRKLIQAQQYSKAISFFRKASQGGDSPLAFYHLGEAYALRSLRSGNPAFADQEDAQKALEAFSALLRKDAALLSLKDAYPFYHTMGLCHQVLGQYPQALESFRKAGRVSPNNPIPQLHAAAARYRMRDFEFSTLELQNGLKKAQSLGIYPQIAKMLRSDANLASLLSVPENQKLLGAYDAANSGALTEAEARERIRRESELKDALMNTRLLTIPPPAKPAADLLVLDTLEKAHKLYLEDRCAPAAQGYRETLRLDRERGGGLDPVQKSVAYERLGRCDRQLGLHEEGLQALESSVREMRQNASAQYHLALAYAQAGRLGASQEALKTAFENAHSPAELRKMLLSARVDEEFEPLRGLDGFRELLQGRFAELAKK